MALTKNNNFGFLNELNLPKIEKKEHNLNIVNGNF